MNAPDEVCAYLAREGIPYELKTHARVSSIAECAPIETLMGGRVPRNLFLAPRNLSRFYLMIAHPGSAFKTSSVSRQAGASRLMFAPEADMIRLLRTHTGALSPLGLIFDENRQVRVLIDEKLKREPWLIFHPCENDASVKLAAADFFGVFLPKVRVEPIYIDMD